MTDAAPPADDTAPTHYDPYRMHSLEQILTLFDGGAFLATFMNQHAELMLAMREHAETHNKGASASLSLQIGYKMNTAGDVTMTATKAFTPPKEPASSSGAYIDKNGDLTLFNPMMRQMQRPLREVTPHDPETGEVRDV